MSLFWRKFYEDSSYPINMETTVFPDGPPSGQIMMVGEAPGAEEEKLRVPFVGWSGQELRSMAADVGLEIEECLLTNVVMERPPGNKFDHFCCKKEDLDELRGDAPYNQPSIDGRGKYLKPEYVWNLRRLEDEILTYNPNLIIPLGATALWALTGLVGIGKYRGSVAEAYVRNKTYKILPTYHPANILRAWENRTIVLADFIKARSECAFPEIRVLNREVWLDPTVEDLWAYYDCYIAGCEILSFDIETAYARKKKRTKTIKGEKRDYFVGSVHDEFIACVSLAPDPTHSIVVPFIDRQKPGFHYWSRQEDEFAAWQFLRFVLENRQASYELLAQNGLFDIQYLITEAQIYPWNYLHDTMIYHHAWMPELSKDLGFIGSVYSNERSWKGYRPRGEQSLKREE